MSKSGSSKRWLEEHHQDVFVQRARDEGYRSRAVYKLIEIQQRDRVLHPGQLVLDLGAAPGAWSEYASQIVGANGGVLAVDLLPMDPIAGVDLVRGDFTEQDTLNRILEWLGARRFDLVLSDMAPNLSGMQSVDQPRSIYLAELAVALSRDYLEAQGSFVSKLFQGEGFDSFVAGLRRDFVTVKLRKPEASRARSNEIYAVSRCLR